MQPFVLYFSLFCSQFPINALNYRQIYRQVYRQMRIFCFLYSGAPINLVHYMAWLNAALFICFLGTPHNRLLYVPTAEYRRGPQGVARAERRLARKTGTRNRHRPALHERHRERAQERLARDHRENCHIL